MGRYADLTFLSEDAALAAPAEFIARETWIGQLVAGLMLLAMAAAPAWLVHEAVQAPPLNGWPIIAQIGIYGIAGVIGLVVGLVGAVGGLAFLGRVLAARKPGNWVLRAGPHGLDVKLRNIADHRLSRDDAVVLRIPKREVRWVRAHDEKARHVGRHDGGVNHDDDTLVRQGYLEIRLHDDDLSAVRERLAAERRLWVPTPIKGITQKAKGAPVSVRPGGILRIDWRTKGTRLRPNLATALAHLAKDYEAAPELKTEQAQAGTLDRAAQESRLLEMVQQGNMIDAVLVAKGLYGLNTTDAKRYIEDLKA